MDVIAVCGRNNSGKSTTLRLLLSNVLQFKDLTKFKFFKDQRTNSWNVDAGAIAKKQNKLKDFTCVFEYNRKKIGLTSFGDSKFLLTRAMDIFVSYECDIAIVACHKEIQLKNYYISYIGLIYKLFIPKKTTKNDPPSVWAKENQDVVDQIISLI